MPAWFDDAASNRGMAFRVPTPDVSVVDLTFTAEKASPGKMCRNMGQLNHCDGLNGVSLQELIDVC